MLAVTQFKVRNWDVPAVTFEAEDFNVVFPVTGIVGNSVPTSVSGRTGLAEWKASVAVAAKVELTRFGGHLETWGYHPRKGSSHAEDESTISARIQG